jgi:hypothetical protein
MASQSPGDACGLTQRDTARTSTISNPVGTLPTITRLSGALAETPPCGEELPYQAGARAGSPVCSTDVAGCSQGTAERAIVVGTVQPSWAHACCPGPQALGEVSLEYP